MYLRINFNILTSPLSFIGICKVGAFRPSVFSSHCLRKRRMSASSMHSCRSCRFYSSCSSSTRQVGWHNGARKKRDEGIIIIVQLDQSTISCYNFLWSRQGGKYIHTGKHWLGTWTSAYALLVRGSSTYPGAITTLKKSTSLHHCTGVIHLHTRTHNWGIESWYEHKGICRHIIRRELTSSNDHLSASHSTEREWLGTSSKYVLIKQWQMLTIWAFVVRPIKMQNHPMH